jgi:cell division protein FtsB
MSRRGRDRDRRRGIKTPRVLVVVAGSIALAAVLFLFVLPTRTYLSQRQSLSAAETRLRVFRSENAALAAQAKQLQTNSYVENLAGQQYGLVLPGQQALTVTPSSTQASSGAAAKAPKARPKRGLLSRAWHDVQFWH